NNKLYLGRTYLLPNVSDTLLATAKTSNSENTPSPSTVSDPPDSKPLKNSGLEEEGLALNVPYFGKTYENLKVKDQQLKGAVYYLLAVHGGPDPGALGKYGPYLLSEDECAYAVTIRLARRLMEHGAT